ncbi:Ribonuclease H-like domain [Cinara cedri]|uniref:Ribonuclease H-like domain n=1 Tax=Cinara cedri TaxID=506608 RepID=A0A5E4NI34_9HEMI|nr:Ribonuclease H-like domain [Cinara cedri]
MLSLLKLTVRIHCGRLSGHQCNGQKIKKNLKDFTLLMEKLDVIYVEKFSLDQDDAISAMRKIIYDQTIDPKNVMSAFYIFLKTFPYSTAECERGFSVMNNICTDLCSRLMINNISNLMFININGLSLSDWNPEDYVKSWLFNHRCAEDTRTKIARNNIGKFESKVIKKSLWQIL